MKVFVNDEGKWRVTPTHKVYAEGVAAVDCCCDEGGEGGGDPSVWRLLVFCETGLTASLTTRNHEHREGDVLKKDGVCYRVTENLSSLPNIEEPYDLYHNCEDCETEVDPPGTAYYWLYDCSTMEPTRWVMDAQDYEVGQVVWGGGSGRCLWISPFQTVWRLDNRDRLP